MGVMKSLFSGKQMSEAFICSAFLALSGGFQDAYTYNTRNEVFSNAQTGNVVLMSQNFMTGKWEAGLKYLFPLFAFALGVLIAEQIQHKYKYAKRLHWRQGILGAEIIILFIVGFIPQRGKSIQPSPYCGKHDRQANDRYFRIHTGHLVSIHTKS